LSKSLEPTYGEETTFYELGAKISVHDLAGQEIIRWLETPDEIFNETDLILIMVDCRSKWPEIQHIWEKVLEHREQTCPNAIIAIFFHKIDLIDEQTRKSLDQQLSATFGKIKKCYAYQTSINPDFFTQTLQIFSDLMKKTLNKADQSRYQNFFSKLTILSQFIKASKFNYREFQSEIPMDISILNSQIKELHDQGLISVFESLGVIELTDKGKEMISDMNQRFSIKIAQSIKPKYDYIRGCLISDEFGKTFFQYESEPGYFQHLKSVEAAFTDPSLITMFFTAIKDFGKTIDEFGINRITFQGQRIQIVSVISNSLHGIFFLREMDINKLVFNTLDVFIIDIANEFSKELTTFLNNGFIPEDRNISERFNTRIEHLNEAIHEIIENKKTISNDKLFNLYQRMEQQSIQPDDIKDLKKVLIQYIITENPQLMGAIIEWMDRVN
jgi:predicted transcriptional regulator